MKQKIGFSIVLLLFICCSCKKFLEIPAPKTQAQTDVIFANDDAAISAAIGLYSEMSRINLNIMNGGMTIYPSLTADDLYNTSPNADIDPFTNNSILPGSTTGLGRLWTPAYKNIYQANAVLEGLARSTVVKDSVKNQLRGEMLVVRAFNYFCLINLFGDVPLQLSTDYRINATLGRSPVSEIYNQVTKDLVEAKSLLSVTYASLNRARPNKWVAAALLARVYLYRRDWAKAEEEANNIIQSGNYALVTNLNNVFLPVSAETIWQLVRDNSNTAEGATFVPSSATVKPTYAITNYLLNAFEGTDQRKINWLNKNTVSSINYYYPYKYKIRSATTVSEYYVVLRLAEQYLIRAEARAQQNKLTEAKNDINTIRQRAGLANITATDQNAVLAAVEHERQAELFAEWGHRWFDLIRTARADAVLGIAKAPNWQTTDKLYPLQQYDIDTNPFLVQNPGY